MKTNLTPNPAQIKVIGMGGGGCNAVERMVAEGIPGVEFMACNSDAQALAMIDVPNKLQLGDELTKGLGAGGDPEVGRAAAEETANKISEFVEGADMVFITAGLGGGTGTGSAPVAAALAKESGALTIAVCTKPFAFEGARRMMVAKKGIAQLINKVDTLVLIPNDRLFAVSTEKTLMQDAFKTADSVLQSGVEGIAGLITIPGIINLDFADVKAIMKEAGAAWMSIGYGSGQHRAVEAANKALASPLLEVSIEGAHGILFNISGGKDLTLHEVREAAAVISRKADPDANIIFGVGFDSKMDKEVKLTLVATGFTSKTSLSAEEELDQLGLEEETELDIPSFLRRSVFSQREKATNISSKVHSLRDQFPAL